MSNNCTKDPSKKLDNEKRFVSAEVVGLKIDFLLIVKLLFEIFQIEETCEK